MDGPGRFAVEPIPTVDAHRHRPRTSVHMRRTVATVLVVGAFLSLASAIVSAVPSRAGGAATLTVSPTKGLIDPLGDGQFVRATWTGMPPGESVYLRQCSRRPTTVKDCSLTGSYLGPGLITAGIAQPDGSGSVVFSVRVGLVNATL